MTERREMLQPPSRKVKARVQATTGNLKRLRSKSS